MLDCTLGGGGHAITLLEAGVSRVVGVDRDPEALSTAADRLRPYADAGRFEAIESNYAAVDEVPELSGATFDGILLDLGVSSHQVDAESRGFTFRPGAPLDMRMGPDASGTAADFLNEESERSLTDAFRLYADEPRAARLAREITRRRANRRFDSSDDLVGAIRAVLGPKSGAPDFARIFQAVRIAINDELSGLERALPVLRDRLAAGGTMVVIAYHSGEDRLVKHAFREWERGCVCPPRQPVCTCGRLPAGHTEPHKPIVSDDAEIAGNPRARSARLRVFRVNDDA